MDSPKKAGWARWPWNKKRSKKKCRVLCWVFSSWDGTYMICYSVYIYICVYYLYIYIYIRHIYNIHTSYFIFHIIESIYIIYQLIQSDLFIPYLEITSPARGSLNHPKKGTKNSQVSIYANVSELLTFQHALFWVILGHSSLTPDMRRWSWTMFIWTPQQHPAWSSPNDFYVKNQCPFVVSTCCFFTKGQVNETSQTIETGCSLHIPLSDEIVQLGKVSNVSL